MEAQLSSSGSPTRRPRRVRKYWLIAVSQRRVAERLDCELAAHRGGHLAVFERREHGVVVRVIDDDGGVLVVLRRGAQHGRAADVDVLDRFGIGAVGACRRRFERVEIHDEQVDDAYAMAL
jgi:hypothetical protein